MAVPINGSKETLEPVVSLVRTASASWVSWVNTIDGIKTQRDLLLRDSVDEYI